MPSPPSDNNMGADAPHQPPKAIKRAAYYVFMVIDLLAGLGSFVMAWWLWFSQYPASQSEHLGIVLMGGTPTR